MKALSLIDTERFDLVITDLKMSPVSGIEILKRLKSSEFEGRTLVMSACPQGYENKLQHLKVDVLLEKPFELNILFELIRKLTERQVCNVSGEKIA